MMDSQNHAVVYAQLSRLFIFLRSSSSSSFVVVVVVGGGGVGGVGGIGVGGGDVRTAF